MGTRRSRSERSREVIDEYDLGQRFKRWARETSAKVGTYVLLHPRPLAYSALAILTLSITWWVAAHHRPAEPPPPSAWRIQQMMDAVQKADARVREEHAGKIGQEAEFRGVFETMRDVPVPLSNNSREQSSQDVSQVPEGNP